MRISDWSSDVCSSDLGPVAHVAEEVIREPAGPSVEEGLRHGDRDREWQRPEQKPGEKVRIDRATPVIRAGRWMAAEATTSLQVLAAPVPDTPVLARLHPSQNGGVWGRGVAGQYV